MRTDHSFDPFFARDRRENAPATAKRRFLFDGWSYQPLLDVRPECVPVTVGTRE